MAGGKLWTAEEISLLEDMAERGMNPQQIYDSGSLPGRTLHSIVKQFYSSMVKVKPGAKVITIEPAQNALTMERVVKLFTTAFEQICALKEIDKFALERFRIVFQAAKDYGPLLAGYEKWDRIEKQIEELAATVAELQAAKSAKKAS
jgi:hypothetical protein